MADWSSSMQQTFEYYTVDPNTWKDVKKLDTVKSCTISWDADSKTLGSATLEVVDMIGETYIRVYLITIQNGVTEKHPLGTFLVQTPSSSYDGKTRSTSMDAYTPLIELKEKQPPIGYAIFKDSDANDIMENACRLTEENLRAPVVKITVSDASSTTKLNQNFVAETDDTWLTFLTDLMANAKYTYSLDELGRVLFSPKQDTASLQPVWTYSDDSTSILYHDVSVNHDLYDIPNVVEVVYTNTWESLYAEAVNDDPNSPTSTVSRGRRITHRVTNPDINGGVFDNDQLKAYAEQLLQDLSSIEYTVSYSHGYCPVRLGDCVRINYAAAGLSGVKAKVISQSIKCEPGCPVSEKAVFTTKLWR